MTKKEFEKYIDDCSYRLWYPFLEKGSFLCILFSYNNPSVSRYFKKFIIKSGLKPDQSIFGPTYNIKNQCDRFFMLYLFEQYCIDEGLYKYF